MACDLISFLREKGGAATTQEIAADLLKMPNAPLAVAESLVQSMCKDQAIKQTSPHVWEICDEPVKTTPANDEWVLLTTVPVSCPHWRSVQAILMAEMSGIECVERHIVIRSQGLTEQDWLHLLDLLDEKWVVIEGLGNQVNTLKSGLKNFAKSEPVIHSLAKSVKMLIADQPLRTSNDMAQLLKSECYEWPEPEKKLDQLIQNAQAFMDILNVNHPEQLMSLWVESKREFTFDRFNFDRDDVNAVPATPGIYLIKDARQNIIYVGKAKNLARRLMSYFLPGAQNSARIQAIHQQMADFEFESLGSELEALLSEWEMIQKYDPPINRQLRVHQRSHRQAERYERILFLPAKDPQDVQIYFLHPRGAFARCRYRDHRQMNRLANCVKSVFFTSLPVSDIDKTRCEISWSWLSETKSPVHSLDMRGITLEREALRLIKDHVKSFRSDTERVIQT
jgi:hypothetical protein